MRQKDGEYTLANGFTYTQDPFPIVFAAVPNGGIERSTLRIWAFVSVTNNYTQLVTTIRP